MFSYSIPNPTLVESVADWVEFYITYPKTQLSQSGLFEYLETETGKEPKIGFIQDIWKELTRRKDLYGDSPPYRIDDKTISRAIEWRRYPEYMTCLIFSLEGNPDEPAKSGKLFERITNEAIKNFINGECLIYGYPSKIPLPEICDSMHERFICHPPNNRKDRNIDIFAWKSFKDNRESQVVILIQCKAGDDWKDKTTELVLDAWHDYIHFGCNPIKGYSIPVIIPNKYDMMHEISRNAGMIIDRARLYRNLISGTRTDRTLRRELTVWCNARLQDMNEA